jgi:hypothetical protein
MGMPTILRRFSSRLRNHDWTAVLIEMVIVVAGVFLGIQAANWNEARQDRREEQRVYKQLIEDLNADLDTLQVTIDRSRTYDRAAENVLAAMRSGNLFHTNPAQFALDVHYAGFLFLPRPARRTYDELVSTGGIRLLRNDAAKGATADYYASFDSSRQWDPLLRQQQADYWRLTAGVVPRHVLQAAIRFRIPDVTTAEAASILAAARRRPEIADLLVGMAAHQERVRRDSEQQSRMTRELIRQLQPLSR